MQRETEEQKNETKMCENTDHARQRVAEAHDKGITVLNVGDFVSQHSRQFALVKQSYQSVGYPDTRVMPAPDSESVGQVTRNQVNLRGLSQACLI